MARPSTPPPEPPPGARWLVFVTQLPTDDPAGRMKVLRTLETFGCAPLRDGAYLLPDSPENRGGLAKLARFVASINGSVHVLHVKSADEAQSKEFSGLLRPLRAVPGARQDGGVAQGRVRDLRPGRDQPGARQAAPRPRGDRRARLLRLAAARQGRARARRDGGARARADLPRPGARLAVGRRRALESHLLPARLGDAQAAVHRPARLRLAHPPLHRPGGGPRLARQGPRRAGDRGHLRLRRGDLPQQPQPRHLRRDARELQAREGLRRW